MKITRSHWRSISSTSSNFSSVFLASLIVPIIIGELDVSKWYVLALGAGLTVLSVYVSLASSEKGKL